MPGVALATSETRRCKNATMTRGERVGSEPRWGDVKKLESIFVLRDLVPGGNLGDALWGRSFSGLSENEGRSFPAFFQVGELEFWSGAKSPKMKIECSIWPNFLGYFCFCEDLLSTFSKSESGQSASR